MSYPILIYSPGAFDVDLLYADLILSTIQGGPLRPPFLFLPSSFSERILFTVTNLNEIFDCMPKAINCKLSLSFQSKTARVKT